MKKRHFLFFALYVGIQSFLLQIVDRMIGPYLTDGVNLGFAFIAFQGWALYFLLGSKSTGIIRGMSGYTAGIAFSIVMILVGNWFSFMGIWAVPITALIVVPFMMYFEYAPWWIGDVAVFFVGAGAYYGIYNYIEETTMVGAAGIVLLYCFLGLLSGWATITFRKHYEIWIKGGNHE